jgi:hypothetical protein
MVDTLLPWQPRLFTLEIQSVATVELENRRDTGVQIESTNHTDQVGMMETANWLPGQVTCEVMIELLAVMKGPVT